MRKKYSRRLWQGGTGGKKIVNSTESGASRQRGYTGDEHRFWYRSGRLTYGQITCGGGLSIRYNRLGVSWGQTEKNNDS